MLPSDDTIQEQAYLVSRGVRPLALIGTCESEPTEMLRVYNKLEFIRTGGAMGIEPIPIVLKRADGSCADVGFAARPWVAETLKWMQDNMPQPHLDRLLGLMMGYSPDAITANDAWEAGRLFDDAYGPSTRF